MISLSKMFKATLAGAALMSAVTMNAENKVYIEDFTISDYSIINMPVMIEVSDLVNQAQCHVTLPDGLNVNGTVTLNNAVFPDFFRVDYNVIENEDGTTTIIIASFDLTDHKVVQGTNVWATIPVQAEYGLLDEAGTTTVNLSKINLTAPDASNIAVSKVGTANVTLQKYEVIKAATLQCTNAPVVVNPGDTRSATISMSNNFLVRGLQFDIYSPEHISVGNVQKASGVPADWQLKVGDNTDDPNKGYVRVMMLGASTINLGEINELVTFDITADDEFVSSDNIRLSKFELSDTQYNTIFGTAPTFEVVSGQIAFEQAMLMISEGEGSLSEYITTAMGIVAEECPLVAEDFNFMPFFNEVQQLMGAVESAYNDYTLTPNFQTIVTDPIAQVKEEVDAFVEEARTAEAAEVQRRADNQEAYNADIAAIDALQASLDAAKAQIRELYAGFEDEAAEAAVQAQIDALRTAADEAYAAVAEEGNYETTLDTAAVETAIAALVNNAKIAKEAEDARVAANQAAYNADIEAIDALQTSLDAAKAQIRELYAGFEDEAAEAAVQAQIDALRTAADEAYAAVAEEGNYETTLDTAAVETAIAALITNAEAAAQAAEDARVAANLEAYNADNAALDALQVSFDAAKAQVSEDYPFIDNQEAEAAVQAQIDALRAEVEAAYAAVAEEGIYDYELDTTDVQAQIDGFEEATRVAYNTALYNADIEEITAIRAEYDSALSILAKLDPSLLENDLVISVGADIDASRAAADEAYAAVAEEGIYPGPVFDAQSLRDEIDEMLSAIGTGISEILGDGAVEGVEIYTIDGQRHNTLVRGQINILRIANKTVKVIVK